MWMGNLMLVILNLPLLGMWVRVLRIPYRLLVPTILVFTSIGVYSVRNNVFELWLTAGFGLLGYLFDKLGCEPAPLSLGCVLGLLLEETLERALLLSRGDPLTFVQRPISAALLITACLLLMAMLMSNRRWGWRYAAQMSNDSIRKLVCGSSLDGEKSRCG